MKATLPLFGINTSKKIFIWYDFKQIRDAILLVFFSEKTNRYERVFIYGNAEGWETDILQYCTDGATYKAICKRLKQLFNTLEAPTKFKVYRKNAAKNFDVLQQA